MQKTTKERRVNPSIDPISGNPVYDCTLTPAERTDTVKLICTTMNVLPIVFVPGIMGSNLMSAADQAKVWRLDSNEGLWWDIGGNSAGWRQRMLHPARTAVDNRGSVPDKPVGVLTLPAHFTARGWGEVGKTSYQEFLIWLEDSLNGGKDSDGNHELLNLTTILADTDGTLWGEAQKKFNAFTKAENKEAVKWYYPVYACGYNWLDSNSVAAKRLQARINKVITDNNKGMGKCKQVIVVTHSMGGLVARACSKLPGMEDKIAGVVHGVMPATGAAVAYRRCKVGMWDEGSGAAAAGAARVIGQSGQEITAVFAQAPGALQLLPNTQYAANWLEVRDSSGALLPEQPNTEDPYENIYKERNKWWGLVKEEWLSPEDGEPITWDGYVKFGISEAKKFHSTIKDYYHPKTYGFYGTDVPSFQTVTWRVEIGDATKKTKTKAPTQSSIMGMHRNALRMDGTNPEEVPGPDVQHGAFGISVYTTQTDYYQLRLTSATDRGDGTVPVVSGREPASGGGDAVKQIFSVAGVEHEPAYKSVLARNITVYSINKIALTAKAIE